MKPMGMTTGFDNGAGGMQDGFGHHEGEGGWDSHPLLSDPQIARRRGGFQRLPIKR